MIGDGEGAGGAAVEGFEAEFVLDAEPALLAEEAVEVDGGVDGSDAVFGEHHDLDAALGEELEQVPDDAVDAPEVFGDVRVIRAEALEVVVEVREVDEVERGLVVFLDPLGGPRDPAGGGVGRALG